MATKKSKNNPEVRNKGSEVPKRTCEFCGTTDEIGKIQRVLRGRRLVWKCKDKHYDEVL